MRLLLVWVLSLWVFHLPAQVDYRYYQSPAKNVRPTFSQAAAVASMFEIALGGPACMDVQHLAQVVPGPTSGTSSPYLFQYAETLVQSGFKACGLQEGQQYKSTAGTVFKWSASQAQNPSKVKSLLERGQKGIAVNYLLPLDVWEKAGKGKSAGFDLDKLLWVNAGGKAISYGKAKKKYPDLAKKLRSKEFKLALHPKDSVPRTLIGATVVGYDDQGFWIKGSNGPEWGENGYIKMPYLLHEWACQEVLAILMVEPDMAGVQGPPHIHRFQLRTLPEYLEGKPIIQLFLVEGGLLPASPVTHLQYEVIPSEGDTLAPKVYKSLISDVTAQSGFPVMATITSKERTYTVKVKYRCENGEVREFTYSNVGWQNACHEP